MININLFGQYCLSVSCCVFFFWDFFKFFPICLFLVLIASSKFNIVWTWFRAFITRCIIHSLSMLTLVCHHFDNSFSFFQLLALSAASVWTKELIVIFRLGILLLLQVIDKKINKPSNDTCVLANRQHFKSLWTLESSPRFLEILWMYTVWEERKEARSLIKLYKNDILFLSVSILLGVSFLPLSLHLQHTDLPTDIFMFLRYNY